jgi:hypothetical protein
MIATVWPVGAAAWAANLRKSVATNVLARAIKRAEMQ